MSQIQKSADEQFQNHYAKTDQMLHEVQAEKERLELRLGQLQGELEALKTQLETVHAINGTRQKQIDALTSELVEGQTTLNTKMQELHDLQISLAGEIRQMTDAHAKEIHALQESKTQLSLAFIESSEKASKEAEAALEAERTSTRLEREKAHAESLRDTQTTHMHRERIQTVSNCKHCFWAAYKEYTRKIGSLSLSLSLALTLYVYMYIYIHTCKRSLQVIYTNTYPSNYQHT